MLKKYSFIICFFISNLSLELNFLYAQKQANNWYFGDSAGISFSQNTPIKLDDSRMASNGGATVSQSHPFTGQLLFYSNGESVWNRDHNVMLNGEVLMGTSYSTNSAYTVPNPGNSNQYYLFTVKTDPFVSETQFRSATIYYSSIDMTLDSGKGAVVEQEKNILLEDSVTEKIVAIPHRNGKGYWVILHQVNNNTFSIYQVTASGISINQQVSIGTPHFYTLTELQGHMKASPDNQRVAVTLRSSIPPSPFEVFDFDNSTGVLSNAQYLGDYALQYGVSFSPNSKLLYLNGYAVTGVESGDAIYQFNLEDDNPIATRKGILRLNPAFSSISGLANLSLQIGPDGKIYGAGNLSETSILQNSLLVINQPNEVGLASDVTILNLNWSDIRVGIDLPNFIQSDFNNLTPSNNPNAPCTGRDSFILFPNPTSSTIEINVTERCFSPYKLSIYNVLGQFIESYEVSETNSGTIDTSYLSAGVYLAVLEIGPSRITKRFMKLDGFRD